MLMPRSLAGIRNTVNTIMQRSAVTAIRLRVFAGFLPIAMSFRNFFNFELIFPLLFASAFHYITNRPVCIFKAENSAFKNLYSGCDV